MKYHIFKFKIDSLSLSLVSQIIDCSQVNSNKSSTFFFFFFFILKEKDS